MARFSSSGTSSTSDTCISDALPTSVTTGAPLSRSAWMFASSCTAVFARRVVPKAVSLACVSSRPCASLKNSSSLGLEPGQPPSMKWTPSWSSRSAMRSLSCTERLIALHLRTVAQGRVIQRYARHEIHSFAAPSFQHPRGLSNVQQKNPPLPGTGITRGTTLVPPRTRRRSAERHHAPAFGNGRRTRSDLLSRHAGLRLTAREGYSTGAAHRSHTVTGSLDRRGPVYSSPSQPLLVRIPRE